MHAVVLQIRILRIPFRIDKEAVDIEIFGVVFTCYVHEAAVSVLDDIVADPCQVHGQDALDHDCSFFVPGGEVPHELLIAVRDEVLLHGNVVDAGHEEDIVGVVELRTDPVPARQQAFDRLAGNAKVGHGVIRKAPLPVEPLGQGIADEDEMLFHRARFATERTEDSELLMVS